MSTNTSFAMAFASHFPESAERTTSKASKPMVKVEKPWSNLTLSSVSALYPDTGSRLAAVSKWANHKGPEKQAQRTVQRPYERPPTPPPCKCEPEIKQSKPKRAKTPQAKTDQAKPSLAKSKQSKVAVEPPMALTMEPEPLRLQQQPQQLYHQHYLPPYLANYHVPFQPYHPSFQPVNLPVQYHNHSFQPPFVPSYAPSYLPGAYVPGRAEFRADRGKLAPAPKLTSPIFLEPALQTTEKVKKSLPSPLPARAAPPPDYSRPFYHYVPSVASPSRGANRRVSTSGMPTPEELDQKQMNEKQLRVGKTELSTCDVPAPDAAPGPEDQDNDEPEHGQQSSADQDLLESPKNSKALPSPPESPLDGTEAAPKTCISCGCSQSPCWRPSWAPALGQLCNSCGLRYKKTGARCVNANCGKIPSKGEWNIMARGAKRNGYGDLQYSCLSCEGQVMLRK